MERRRGRKMIVTIVVGFAILAILFAWSVVRMRAAAGLPAWGYREGGPTSTPTLTPTSTPGPTPTAHPGGSDAQPGDSKVQLSNTRRSTTPEQLPSSVGEKIAFVSSRTGQPQVYVINSDGSHLLELTDEENGAKLLGWTRLGWLAVLTWPEGKPVIDTLNAAGQERARLVGLPTDGLSYAWTVDGRYVAISRAASGNLDLFVMRQDGSQQTTIVSSPAREDQPAWSPDGNRLVFVSDRDRWEGDLYITNRDGTGLTRLTDDEMFESDPVWSPDGAHIAFIVSTGLHDQAGDVFIIETDGSNRQQLTDEATQKCKPAWSQDSSHVSFQSYEDHGWGLYVLSIADGTITLLADGLNPEAMTLYTPPEDVEPEEGEEEEKEEEEPAEELPPLTAAERTYLETVLDLAVSYDQAVGELEWLMEVADENMAIVLQNWWRNDAHAAMTTIREQNGQRVRELVPPARCVDIHNDLIVAATSYNTVADLISEARDTVDGYPIYRAREEFIPVGDAAMNQACEKTYQLLNQ